MRGTLFVLSFILLLSSCSSNDTATNEQDSWALIQKKVFRYSLNNLGHIDTTFLKIYRYKDLVVSDSSEFFAVNSYQDAQPASKIFYAAKKTSAPLPLKRIDYTFTSKNQPSTVVATINGVLEKKETYFYDTANRLIKTSIINIKKKQSENPDEGDFTEQTIDAASGYDTLHINYRYDAGNKNIGGDFTDNQGRSLRKDINIYSGNTPLTTYSLGPNGDTLQRVSYVIEGKVLRSVVEKDDLTYVDWNSNGLPLGNIKIDKKSKEQLKRHLKYDQGRLVGEDLYKKVL